MKFIIVLLAFTVATYAMTDLQMYTALYNSLTALEANPTPTNLAKIDIILKSTNFMRLQTVYGSGKKRFVLKGHKNIAPQKLRQPAPVRHAPVRIMRAAPKKPVMVARSRI